VRLELGRLFATPGALKGIAQDEMIVAINRHRRGDWGNVGRKDRWANDLAVKNGTRLLSSYTTRSGVKFWIITEADRSLTTITLPEEC
jgi:hypothetical protein